MWRVARDSRTLDLNSTYAYVLFARDFAETSRVAVVDGEVAGFVLGYRRPSRPDCQFVWQIAVDERFRGLGLAGRLLDSLVREARVEPAVRTLETTITDDNVASQRTFRSFADRWDGAPVRVSPLFESAHLSPGDSDSETHEPERLYEIGPPIRP